jgi:hypothetical protein
MTAPSPQIQPGKISMKAERWRHIESLYYTALERDATEREALLAEACAGDEELRQEVESPLHTLICGFG